MKKRLFDHFPTRWLSLFRQALSDRWGVRLIALLVALMGGINVLSAVTPSLADRLAILETYSPLVVRRGGHLTAALAGFALFLLARGLARRKHAAWLLALVVLAVSALSHLIKGLDYEEASLAGGLMLLLGLTRAHFHARSDRPSIQQGLRVLGGAFLFTLAYGIAGFYLLDRHYSHFIYEHVNRFYNFKGLHSFKEKFHPEWSPRYLIYPGAASLSQVWLAVVKANS